MYIYIFTHTLGRVTHTDGYRGCIWTSTALVTSDTSRMSLNMSPY